MSFIPFVWTRSYGLPLSVESGGHDTAGRALSEGVVIDLSQMRTVTVDPDQRTAHVQAGATIVIRDNHPIWVGDSDRNLPAVGMADLPWEEDTGTHRGLAGY